MINKNDDRYHNSKKRNELIQLIEFGLNELLKLIWMKDNQNK